MYSEAEECRCVRGAFGDALAEVLHHATKHLTWSEYLVLLDECLDYWFAD